MESKYGPRCPNHKVLLQLTDTPGIGICPISTCRFDYEVELENGEAKTEYQKDISGNIVKVNKYKVSKKDKNDTREK